METRAFERALEEDENEAKERAKELLHRKNEELALSVREEIAEFDAAFRNAGRTRDSAEKLKRLRAKLSVVHEEMTQNYDRLLALEKS